MAQCKKCGEELSSTAVFCKKCGTAIVKETNTEGDINQETTFQELSLEMRDISDRMIAHFVSAMKQMEVEKKTILENLQNEVSSLKNQLLQKDKELENVKEMLEIRENELKRSKERLLELENNLIQTSGNDIESTKIEEKIQFCYGCGELITEDMLFCGSCGMKLK